jgi:hypothetical protein
VLIRDFLGRWTSVLLSSEDGWRLRQDRIRNACPKYTSSCCGLLCSNDFSRYMLTSHNGMDVDPQRAVQSKQSSLTSSPLQCTADVGKSVTVLLGSVWPTIGSL